MRAPTACRAAAQNRETFDLTLFAGVRLWQGAEFWFNPEIDQGFGLDDTHGVAGFSSAEAYKLGDAYPYARVQRAFLRQTINLGGDTEKVDDDINQFAGTRSSDRLVLTCRPVRRLPISSIPTNTPTIRRSISSTGRRSTPAHSTMPAMAGATPTAPRRNGIRVAGRCAPAFSICQQRLREASARWRTASIRPFNSSRWSEKSRNATSCGDSRARSRSPDFSAAVMPGTFADAIALAQATGLPADINAVRVLHQPAGCQHQSRTAGDGFAWRLCPRRLGRRQYRALGFHRRRPHGLSRHFAKRQIMGPAGRHHRRRRRHQRHHRRTHRVFQCRWPRYSHRRRAIRPITASRKSSRPITATR